MTDISDFEELIADMLDITDDEIENCDFNNLFYDKFEIDFDAAYEFTKKLLMHTVPIEAGMSKKHYHAFVSKDKPIMLMKVEAL